MAFKKSLAAVVFASLFILVNGLPSFPCDFLKAIKTDLIDYFDNECGDAAHGALRLAFHDAIGYSPTLGGGGADGSIIIFNETELLDPGNDGLDDVLGQISPLYFKHAHAITPGDFIQFAGAISLSLCPGAPRVKYFIGRPPPIEPAPGFIVPRPDDTTDKILATFAAVNFTSRELIALLASHSVAGADDLSPPLTGVAFDSTPSVFDTNIYIEVLLKGSLYPQGATVIEPGVVGTAIEGTIRMQSDSELARDKRTACIWQSFATDHESMITQFAEAFFKMGLLGQANNRKMTDCSSVIPKPPNHNNHNIKFPPGKSVKDIDQVCSIPFPHLPTAPGPPLKVPEIPQVVVS